MIYFLPPLQGRPRPESSHRTAIAISIPIAILSAYSFSLSNCAWRGARPRLPGGARVAQGGPSPAAVPRFGGRHVNRGLAPDLAHGQVALPNHDHLVVAAAGEEPPGGGEGARRAAALVPVQRVQELHRAEEGAK